MSGIYHEDPAQEELAIEFWGRYDYAREANAGMDEDPATLRAEMEDCARQDEEERDAFGPLVIAPDGAPFVPFAFGPGGDIPF